MKAELITIGFNNMDEFVLSPFLFVSFVILLLSFLGLGILLGRKR